ncbi:hypothetical protein, partial [Geminisphaera colitermitum]|uniref:hypothetical protein n=1 Tax=Geminisphaera colitermitum TaxID=1148786 RepID=UPI0005BBADCD
DAPPSPTRFESTWTTNLYDTGTHRFYYSILTPLTVVETGTGRIDASTTGFIPGRRDHDAASRPSRWFTLRSDDGQLLFVANRDITGNQFTSGRLVLEFAPSARSAPPVALGYVRLPREPAAPLETIARFYQTLLACQPIQCAQVQRGDEVELTYEYRLRPTHNAGNAANAEPFTDTIQPPANAAPLAPLPHLLQTWLKTAAGRDALAPGKLHPADLQTSPDGWPWLASRHTLRHTLPATRTTSVRHGINIWLNRATRENYAELAAQGCQHIRLVLRSESKWDWANADELKTLVQRNLAWIRETGAGKMQAYPALFGSWAPDLLHKATGFGDTPDALAAQAEWLRRWQAIMDWCRPYADVIACYDLLNEPRIFSEHHDVTAYYEFLRRNLPALRAAAGPVPLLIEVANMANPVGLNHWRTPDPAADDTNTIIGYHDYWPHMFTHQQVVDPQPVVFYPSFMPMIEWKAPSWRNDSKHWHYWDRWKCDAVNYPVFKHLVENVPANTRMDCGEYGVVGYAGKAPQSGSIWLTHALERFDRLGINHAVWGINGGYTWTVPAFKQTILDHWKRKSDTSDQ